MLVSELIDRAYNGWLYPAGIQRPTFDVLATALVASLTDLTVTLEGRVQNVPRDSVLEVDSEAILVKSVSGAVVTAKERAYLETDLAAHAVGTKVYVDPKFPRKTVFNTVRAVIAGLFPRVYARKVTDLVYTTRQVMVLPIGARRVLRVLTQDTSNLEQWTRLMPGEIDVLDEFEPPKVLFSGPGSEGANVRVVYMSDFTLPTDETKDLTTDGFIPDALAEHLDQAVAGNLLLTRELPRVQIEEVRRFLAAQGIQVGAALNVGQALLQDFERRHVSVERARLLDRDPPGFEFVGPRG